MLKSRDTGKSILRSLLKYSNIGLISPGSGLLIEYGLVY